MPRYTALALDRDAPQVSALPMDGDPCAADEVADHADPRPATPGPAGLSWYLRSVDEVLTYLGAVQRREEEGVPYPHLRRARRGPHRDAAPVPAVAGAAAAAALLRRVPRRALVGGGARPRRRT